MDSLIITLYMVYKFILYSTIIGSIMVFIILLLRFIVKDKLGIKFQYALWFILIIKLTMPILPEASFSIFNYSSLNQLSSNIINVNSKLYLNDLNISKQKVQDNYLESNNKNNLIYKKNKNTKKYKLKISDRGYYTYYSKEFFKIFFQKQIIFFIWLTGVILFGFYAIITNIKFNLKISKNNLVNDDNILNILMQCKYKLNIKRNIPIIKSSNIKSPILIGTVMPKIIIPNNLENKISIDSFRYIILHELLHYKRKDIIKNYLITCICIFHWFNPMIWYGFYKMKQDCELCCDESVLSYLKDKEVKEYGYTIINLISGINGFPKTVCAASMIKSKSQAKKRITMIKVFKKRSLRLCTISYVILLMFSAVTLTNTNAEQFTKDNLDISYKRIVGIDGKIRKLDKIDYPFIDDLKIIGKWVSVDFVKEISQFKPNNKWCTTDLFLKEMNFLKGGKTEYPWWNWTKDIITHSGSHTASKYFIKEIDGYKYMFFQWKSGDYIFRERKPYYYVLKKAY